MELYKLSSYYNIPVSQLKQKTYQELEDMNTNMQKEQTVQNYQVTECPKAKEQMILRHCYILPLLLRYWDYDKVIKAIHVTMSDRDIIKEEPVRPENTGQCRYMAERYPYLGKKQVTLPRYTKSGERLMEDELKTCHIFETPNSYQHLRHAPAIHLLLQDTYPELYQFQIDIYGLYWISDELKKRKEEFDKYQIYIKENDHTWYAPLDKLVKRDAKGIYQTTWDYAKSYNSGYYQTKNIEDAAKTDGTKHLFDVIRNLPQVPIRTDKEVLALIQSKLTDMPPVPEIF